MPWACKVRRGLCDRCSCRGDDDLGKKRVVAWCIEEETRPAAETSGQAVASPAVIWTRRWQRFRLVGAPEEGGAAAIRFGKSGGSVEGLPSCGGYQGD
jgi:hypothetical protein